MNVNVLTANSFNLLFRGIITSWFGSSIPAGWELCDGNNGTPNLTDRFILGSNSNFNQIGGAFEYRLTADQIPLGNHPGIASRDGGSYGVFGAPCTDNRAINVKPPFFRLAYIMKL